MSLTRGVTARLRSTDCERLVNDGVMGGVGRETRGDAQRFGVGVEEEDVDDDVDM